MKDAAKLRLESWVARPFVKKVQEKAGALQIGPVNPSMQARRKPKKGEQEKADLPPSLRQRRGGKERDKVVRVIVVEDVAEIPGGDCPQDRDPG